MKRVLFFSNSPDLGASLRFFINVPLFLLLAAGLLWGSGADAFGSRWTPDVLAVTHLLTLGVLASAMIGALLQILPVTSRIYVLGTSLTARVVHATLTLGTLALALSFMTGSPVAARAATLLLSVAFGWFLIAVGAGYMRHHHKRAHGSEPLLRAAQLALMALLITIALGIALLSVRAWETRIAIRGITDIHGVWGLLGWMGLLLMGVSFKVIPVFQSTELYPRVLMRFLAPAVFILLMIWTVLVTGSPLNAMTPETGIGFALGIAYCGYAGISLILLYTRKRAASDTTTRFWQVTMFSFILSLPAWLWMHIDPDPRTAVTLGILIIMGVGVSAINGMLYKIIPILLWNHIQLPLESPLPIVPKVKNILPDANAAPQFWAHLSALVLLLLASRWPTVFIHGAALMTAISALWLAYNMTMAFRIYLRAKKQIAVYLSQPL